MQDHPKLYQRPWVCTTQREFNLLDLSRSIFMRAFLSSTLGAALFLALLGNSLLAQEQPAAGAPPSSETSQAPSPDASLNRGPNPIRQARVLARKLALTTAQESALEPILAKRQQQVQNARADTTLTPRQRRRKMRAIFRESNRRINAILTNEQRQQYKLLKQERRNYRRLRRQQPTAAPPPAVNP